MFARSLLVFVSAAVSIVFLCNSPSFDPGPTVQAAADDDFVEKPLADRVNDRRFPSVFQTWGAGFTNRKDLKEVENWALHDLSWGMAFEYGLIWDNDEYPGLATGFTADSIEQGLAKRRELLGKNPNMVLLVSLYYRDAADFWFPEDSEWWLRDENGERVIGFQGEGGYVAYLVDYAKRSFRKHIAARARACVKSGVADGIMLDWWNDDSPARIKMLKKIRKAIGPDALIIVNTNQFKRPKSTKYVNGYFMECMAPSAGKDDWDTFLDTLRYAEENLREPQVNCFLTMPEDGKVNERLLRATYAFALVHSNAYAIYSLCGVKGRIPHYHDWYSWIGGSLGKPLEAGVLRSDGAWQRRFENGYAVFNPIDNQTVTIKLTKKHTNAFTRKTAKNHTIPSEDGAILLAKGK
jgi:hypothetical protein